MNLTCCECFVACYVLPAIKGIWIPVIMCDYKDIWNELNMYICIYAYMLISAAASILSTSESADFLDGQCIDPTGIWTPKLRM